MPAALPIGTNLYSRYSDTPPQRNPRSRSNASALQRRSYSLVAKNATKPIPASKAVMIQNLMTTLVSLQPFFSK